MAYEYSFICFERYTRPVSTFDVVAEPTRRRILDLLLQRPRPVGELVSELGLTQPGTSKHLRVLRDAGLVTARHEKQQRWYEVRPEPLRELDLWLAPYRQMWARSLEDLGRSLEDLGQSLDERPPSSDDA